MERNREFEVDYLIGLILVILGLVTAPILKSYLSTRAVAILLVIISIHLVLLTLVYTFRRGTSIEIKQVERIYSTTRFTLFGISIGLSILIFMVLNSAILDLVDNWAKYSSALITHVEGSGLKIMITAVLPVAIVSILTISLGIPVLAAVIEREDIEIGIVPSELRIQSDWKATNPLAISIKNETDRELQAEVKISLPDGVEWRISGEERARTEDISKVIEVQSPGLSALDIEFRNTGGTRRTRELTVRVNYDNVEVEDNVVAFIFP